MRLAEFMITHREPILTEWVAFARSCQPVAQSMDLEMLRDHAGEMLDVIAADLKTFQSRSEQADKSEGKSDAKPDSGGADTAAQAHGAARAVSGYTMEQMVSEYRALRASVIRLWIDAAGPLEPADLQDLIRFNEAIDQALAESTARFMQDLDSSREMFLAMLGHDLRTPLGAVVGWASMLVNANNLPVNLLQHAARILQSGRRMNALVDDLLDFTRTRLGSGIPIVPADMDLAKVCRQAVGELAALSPDRVMNFDADAQILGQWDGSRVIQALSNVLNNAIQHGSATTPINVVVRGDTEGVSVTVQNFGPVIRPDEMNKIFDPMHRIDGDRPVAPRNNLGLGLYITDRIVAAHGGTIAVASSEEHGTTFTIRMPRMARAESDPSRR